MKIISVINLKGGCSKTTTVVNMAHILATRYDKRVLVVDLDKQGNTSSLFGAFSDDEECGVRRVVTYGDSIQESIEQTRYENIDILSANMSLLETEMQLSSSNCEDKILKIKNALEQVNDKYEYCIIDNPPTIDLMVINALVATNDVIVPTRADKWSLDGIREIEKQIEEIRDFNKNINLRGVLLTQTKREPACISCIEWLRQCSGYNVFKSTIRYSKKVDESTYSAKPILEHSIRCGASIDYLKFVKEYMQH